MTSDFFFIICLWVVSFLRLCFDLCVMIRLMSSQLLLLLWLRLRRWLRLRFLHPPLKIFIFDFDSQ